MMKFTKQSSEMLDYDVLFAQWIPSGDLISGFTVALENSPDAYLNITEAYTVNGITVKIWLSGGTNGSTYEIKVLVTTVAGRVKEANFKVRIKDQ